MKPLLLAAVAISLALTASESLAAKFTVHVKPNGKTFTVEPVDEGMVRFTSTRDPAQTKKPSDPELAVVRTAHLTVSDGERDLVAVPVAPRTMRNGHLKYSFEVLKAYVPHTSFRISETEEYKDRTGCIGGGTILSYKIKDPASLKDGSEP